MKYFGIKRPVACGVFHKSRYDDSHNFAPVDEEFSTLGETILKAIELGADTGVPASVTYDEQNSSDVDILASPNHDFFDIAEEFGEQVARATSNGEDVKQDETQPLNNAIE